MKQKEAMTSRCNHSMLVGWIDGNWNRKKKLMNFGKNECRRAKTPIFTPKFKLNSGCDDIFFIDSVFLAATEMDIFVVYAIFRDNIADCHFFRVFIFFIFIFIFFIFIEFSFKFSSMTMFLLNFYGFFLFVSTICHDFY